MQDSIIKGTGNSRLIRSVSDFLTRYPTYGDFAAALVAGTLPIDVVGVNVDGFTVVGTPLNKAKLLPDDVAAQMDLSGDDATVDKAFAWSANGGLAGINSSPVANNAIESNIVSATINAQNSGTVGRIKVKRSGSVSVEVYRASTSASGGSIPSVATIYQNDVSVGTINMSNNRDGQRETISVEVNRGDIIRVDYQNNTSSFNHEISLTLRGYMVFDSTQFFEEVT